jgi:hypothetical protein
MLFQETYELFNDKQQVAFHQPNRDCRAIAERMRGPVVLAMQFAKSQARKINLKSAAVIRHVHFEDIGMFEPMLRQTSYEIGTSRIVEE